jgi:hypothetical protein
MLNITCPLCHRGGSIPQQRVGKPVKCPKCGGVFTPHASVETPGRLETKTRSTLPFAVVTLGLLCLAVFAGGILLVAPLLAAFNRTPSPSQPANAELKAKIETPTPQGDEPSTKPAPPAPQGDEPSTKPAPPAPQGDEPSTKPAPPVASGPDRKLPPQPSEGTPVLKPRNDEKFLVLSELDKKLETYHKLIKPQRGEWKFAEVPWTRTVWEARKKAADEGKPIFIWYMAGVPFGQC